jgi:hypothetical protein
MARSKIPEKGLCMGGVVERDAERYMYIKIWMKENPRIIKAIAASILTTSIENINLDDLVDMQINSEKMKDK